MIASAVGRVLTAVTEDRGSIVLEFEGGQRYQIYACAKVEFDYSADCWLGVERCDRPAPTASEIAFGDSHEYP